MPLSLMIRENAYRLVSELDLLITTSTEQVKKLEGIEPTATAKEQIETLIGARRLILDVFKMGGE